MGNRSHERAIFESLVRTKPDFLGEAIAKWHQPDDEGAFPDIEGVLSSGRRVGVELGEWLSKDQTAAAHTRERAERTFLAAIGAQPENSATNVGFVWISRRPGAKLRDSDLVAFRLELYRCIAEADADGSLWDNPSAVMIREADIASRFGTLIRYIQGLTLFRRQAINPASGVDWIGFPAPGGFYTPDTMVECLLELSEKKRTHYGTSKHGFDHLSLVLFYDQAFFFNTPVTTPWFTVSDAAARAQWAFANQPGPFDSAFVYDSVAGNIFKLFG